MAPNSQRIDARIRDIVEIPLEANVSAGFQWEVSVPSQASSLVTLVEVKWERTSDRVGAPQIQKFRFRTLNSGVADIVFRYKRPWENKVKTERQFSFRIRE